KLSETSIRKSQQAAFDEERIHRAFDRYGKKYARIAFFEQYGLRKDAGLLDEEWHMVAERPSDADIDPSFPEQPYPMRLIGDLLGDRSRDVDVWVQQGPVADFGQ